MDGVEFVKGHGTENDFLVLPDPDGRLDLTPSRVRALCDRSRGLGADGVVRAVRAGRLADGAGADPDGWFLDLRNADGGPAEMSGNGARVYARWLADAGLVRGDLVLATRAGPRPVRFAGDGAITVGMGSARAGGTSAVTAGGRSFDGVAVDVGNPHLVALTDVPVDGIDLTVAPDHDPAAFPHGVNVEFVNVLGPDRLRMRVHERGVGETRSCGTGTVAAATAALTAGGRDGGAVDVDVPGGRLRVELRDGAATLTGPAVLVARGRLDAAWWDAA